MINIKDRCKRFKSAESRRTNWEDTYREALEYFAPQRENFNTHSRGDRRTNTDKIFDSTAITAISRFASKIQAGMTPALKKWIELESGVEIDDTSKEEAEKLLHDVNSTMFKFIHMSNFNSQIGQSYLDLGIGTGALLVNEGDDTNPLQFISVPLDQLYLEEGPFGNIKTTFRKHKMPIRNIQATWPDAQLSQELESKLERDVDAEATIIESTIYQPEKDKYQYSVDLEGGQHSFLEEELDSSPWVVFRWEKLPGEIYGRGPCLSALPDVKTLNRTVEYLLRSAALKMIPTFTVADDGIVNAQTVEIAPGSLIPIAQTGPGGNPIQPLAVGGDINLAMLTIERMQDRISDVMFSDALGPVNQPVKTATEIAERQADLAQRIGASFTRLQDELIQPLVSRILYILNKKGLLSVNLDDVKIDGKEVSIKAISPLAQAQNEEELNNMFRLIQFAQQNAGQLLPAFINIDEALRKVAEKLNVDGSVLADPEQRAQAVQMLSQLSQGMPEQE
jgi:hypothetical protein